MDTRQIRRLIYDGNHERAMQMMMDIIEKQQEEIEELKTKQAVVIWDSGEGD